ncbi:MAG TPA: hypothetical protein VHY21_10025 [Pseudonocardiaceae bacterium]|nr:hypothetical protein [Pseudonocardiaceae bacterium]
MTEAPSWLSYAAHRFTLADPHAVLALPNSLDGRLRSFPENYFMVFDDNRKELTWQQSSSSPADLPAFYAAIVEALGCSCQPAPG